MSEAERVISVRPLVPRARLVWCRDAHGAHRLDLAPEIQVWVLPVNGGADGGPGRYGIRIATVTSFGTYPSSEDARAEAERRAIAVLAGALEKLGAAACAA